MFNQSNQLYPKLNEFLKMAYNLDNAPVEMRNVTLFYSILKRALSINAKMFGHYLARKSALSSFSYSITAKDPSEQIKADETKSRLVNTIDTLVENQLRTVAFGSLLVELNVVKKNNGNQIVISKIFDNSLYDYDFPYIYLFKSLNNSRDFIKIALTENNFLLFDTTEFPNKGGLLRIIMPSEIMRVDALIEFGNYIRKLKGLLQIVNKGTAEENQNAAEKAAVNAISHNYFISDDLIEMKLNQITSGNASAFKDFLDELNSIISTAWLGNANLSQLPRYSGSRAALQVQRLLSADIFYSDMIRTENLINKLLLIDYRFNYNSSAELSDLPWNFSFNLIEEQDIEKIASALETINRAGIPLLKSEVYSKLGFTAPQPNDEIFTGFTES